MGTGFSYGHAAILVENLPRESRVLSALNPSFSWSTTDYLLSLVEYEMRVLLWRQTKDGQKNRNKPEPPLRPAEHEREQEVITIEHMRKVAEELELDIDFSNLEQGGDA